MNTRQRRKQTWWEVVFGCGDPDETYEGLLKTEIGKHRYLKTDTESNDHGIPLFPEVAKLESIGLSLDILARLLYDGLDAELFGHCLHVGAIPVKTFNQILKMGNVTQIEEWFEDIIVKKQNRQKTWWDVINSRSFANPRHEHLLETQIRRCFSDNGHGFVCEYGIEKPILPTLKSLGIDFDLLARQLYDGLDAKLFGKALVILVVPRITNAVLAAGSAEQVNAWLSDIVSGRPARPMATRRRQHLRRF